MKGMTCFTLLAIVMTTVPSSAICQAQEETTVRVRVIAHDAKVVGSGVGGARVYVRDPATGKIVAEGKQEGGTGDTRAIVIDPVKRGSTIFDTPGAAVFTAHLSLTRPTVLEFVGEGPLAYEHAVQRAVKSMLIVPGENILGDGIVLELHGFIVELLEPKVRVPNGDEVSVLVKVRMMCGCPLEPGGLWDADRLQVTARIYDSGRLVRTTPLAYAGSPNTFGGTLLTQGISPGAKLVVLASDPSRANFGSSPTITIR